MNESEKEKRERTRARTKEITMIKQKYCAWHVEVECVDEYYYWSNNRELKWNLIHNNYWNVNCVWLYFVLFASDAKYNGNSIKLHRLCLFYITKNYNFYIPDCWNFEFWILNHLNFAPDLRTSALLWFADLTIVTIV